MKPYHEGFERRLEAEKNSAAVEGGTGGLPSRPPVPPSAVAEFFSAQLFRNPTTRASTILLQLRTLRVGRWRVWKSILSRLTRVGVFAGTDSPIVVLCPILGVGCGPARPVRVGPRRNSAVGSTITMFGYWDGVNGCCPNRMPCIGGWKCPEGVLSSGGTSVTVRNFPLVENSTHTSPLPLLARGCTRYRDDWEL